MDEKRTVEEEIEESLRICEEILNDNPDMVSQKPEIDLEDILGEKPYEASDQKPAGYPPPQKKEFVLPAEEEQPAVTNVAPVKISPKKKEAVKTPKRGVLRTLISIVVCIAIAVGAAFLITHYVANHTTVEGNSMEPCLTNGDELIIEKISYLTGKPERFDVVVFKFNEDTNYIKRVIGLPGEEVRIEEGWVYINDKAIFDEHANGVMEDAGTAEKTITLGADEYFVLGDNRNASKDSRHKDVGAVKRADIIGKAWLRMMPFEKFGFIK